MKRGRILSLVAVAVVTSSPFHLGALASAGTTALGWNAEGSQPGAFLGYSVGSAGDVNGDGFDDVIVGAPRYSHGESGEGEALVYLGSPSGLSSVPAWTAEGTQARAHFGDSVASAGDVNGDGYGDVIVGAVFYDGSKIDGGQAAVYLGSASGLSPTPDWTAEGDQARAHLGISVATAGDVNGDGFDDVIVGAGGYDQGEPGEGGAFVYLGSPSGLTSSPQWIAQGDQAGAHLGFSLGTAGDVNGDGFDDVIVGAYKYDGGAQSEGRALAYLGSPSGPSTTPAWTAEGNQFSAQLGSSVGTAGDVNGDGFDDVIVGAPFSHHGSPQEGRARLYLGSASGLSSAPGWISDGNLAAVLFGFSVGTAGDVNGDGFDDVIVGVLNFGYGRSLGSRPIIWLGIGAARVYLGSPSGLSFSAGWTEDGHQHSSYFGYSVGTAGDVNGDGLDDVIVGAPHFDHGEPNEGRATVQSCGAC